MDLGRIGVWCRPLRQADHDDAAEAAAELEQLGYCAVWTIGGAGDGFFPLADALLAGSKRIVVASGILSIWINSASFLAEQHAAITARHPGRFLLGLGVSHAHVVERLTNRRYERPLTMMRQYLDELEATEPPVPRDELVLAALGPRMLRLSAERSLGAHPYLVNPEHTRLAREVLGPAPLLAPEQAVVLETDPVRARELARQHLSMYLKAPNYVNNFLRLGFSESDVAGGGSDRLVDAIVAWGDPDTVVARIREHHEAGANHVCVQVITGDPAALPRAEWRTLADAWFGR